MTLSPQQISAIHESSLRILEEAGAAFRSRETVDLLAARGFAVDGGIVRMTAEQVMEAVEAAPASFTLEARVPSRDLVFGDDALVIGTAAAPAAVLEGGRVRPATDADLEVFVKLGHAARHVDMIGFPLEPQDVPVAARYDRSVEAALTLSDKPLEYAISTLDHLQTAIDTSEILYGSDWADRLRTFVIVNPVSPLQYEEDACAAIVEMAGRGQPVCIAACAMGGTTGPMTVAGLLALQHAEVLAGITLAQAVRPGSPVVYGGMSSLASMVSGDILIGLPEWWLAMIGTVQLGRFLRVPVRAGGAVTDSHVLDMQAGIESAMGLSAVVGAGVNFVLHGSGMVSSFNAFSPEKLLIDDELVGMLRRLRAGVEVNEDTLAEELIKAEGPGGNYLLAEHTVAHCRDAERVSFFNRRKYDVWETRGALDVVAAARVEVDRLLAAYEPPVLDGGIARAVRDRVRGRMAS